MQILRQYEILGERITYIFPVLLLDILALTMIRQYSPEVCHV